MMPKPVNNNFTKLLWLVLAGFAYFIAAKAGLALATLHQNASPVWPASGIGAAAFVYFGPRAALAIWPASFLINYLVPTGILQSALIASGNTLEPFLAILIYRQLMAVRSEYALVVKVCALPLAALIGSGASALIGTSALLFSESLANAKWGTVFTTWWIGNLLGILVFSPVLVLYKDRLKFCLFEPGRVVESIAYVVVFAILSPAVFINPHGLSFLFFMFPFTLWGAIRFGALEIRILTLLVALISISAATVGLGPFSRGPLNSNLLSLQLFILSIAITGLALSELRQLKKLRLSIIALLGAWLISGAAFSVLQNSLDHENDVAFKNLVDEGHRQLESRERAYVDILTASVSFMHSSDNVTHKDWNTYVRTLTNSNRYPGLLGMGVIAEVPRSKIKEFEQNERRSGRPEFTVHPVDTKMIEGYETSDLDHYVIRLVEPENTNHRVAGLDAGSERHRRDAMDRARDLGKPVASGRFKLMQYDAPRFGFSLIMPYYNFLGVPATEADRKSKIRGWVYTTFVTDEFFKSALDELNTRLEYTVYDPSASGADGWLLANGPRKHLAEFDFVSKYRLGERNFIIGWRRSNSLTPIQDTTAAWVAACGALVGILLAIILSTLRDLGDRAEIIAKEKTVELSEKQAELAASKARLQTLIDSSPVAIMAVDRNNLIKQWNPACEKIFGWTESEALGKWLPFVPPDKIQESKAFIQQIKDSGKPLVFEAERVHKSGSRIVTYTALMPLIDGNGENDGVMAVISDRTEETEAQEALEKQRAVAVQNARMAALGEMASGIAHEINNPLAIITVHSGMLIEHLATNEELDRQKLFRSLNKIEGVSFRIAKIINGLLTFARDPKNDPTEICDVGELVQDALEISGERFKANGVRFESSIEEDLRIECRRGQVSQVILNLLNNAFDAVVGTEFSWIRVEANSQGPFVQIRVIDSGRGIPNVIADKIMEPFFTTKDVGRGTGLGLSISKGIVENHGGKLRLDRTHQRTCFIVELPRFNDKFANG